MTVLIENLEFGAVLSEDGNCLIEIISGVDDNRDSHFINVEELKAAIKFLETEVNR